MLNCRWPGKWLQYRGHLEKLSENMYIEAINAENLKPNYVKNQLTGQYGPVPDTAKAYQANGLKWVVIGETNFGEGSARESAAISPRFLGAAAIIAKSFARIHESNLKKQGLLALTFENESDYDLISPNDRISLLGLSQFAPGQPIRCVIKSSDGNTKTINLKHSFNEVRSWIWPCDERC